MTVLEFHIEEEWDDAARAALEDLVPVRVPRDHHLRGWSGSFVGRYDARDKKWCYIGLLIFGVEEPDGGSVVLRPPPEALELLLRGD